MSEALVLGVKAGIRPEILYEVISSGVAGNFLFRNWAKLIMERNFKSGPRAANQHKDMGITMKIAKDCHVPLFATAVAYEMFEATKAIAPEEDCGAIIKVLEKIVGVEVKKTT